MKKYRINLKQLKPGMVMADDLIHQQTGIVLLSRGVVLQQHHIDSIHKITAHGYCLVELPEDQEPPPGTLEGQGVHGEKNGEKTGEDIIYENITQERVKPEITLQNTFSKKYSKKDIERANHVYRDSYSQIESTFKEAQQDELTDLTPVQDVAQEISSEIASDPEILLQIATLKSFDDYTFTHTVHVAIYSAFLFKIKGASQEDIYQITLAGLLHDIGKIDVPDSILNKPGKLNPEEWEIMKKHVDYGVERLKKIKDLNEDIIEAVAQHHEKIDGSGYPRGLKSSQIHPWARVLTIIDIYDAVTTDRVYRKAFLPHTGVELLMSQVNQVDVRDLHTFYYNIPFYPVGSLVKLNTGETGKVIHIMSELPLRPIIQTFDAGGNPSRMVDLTEELSTFIEGVIEPTGIPRSSL